MDKKEAVAAVENVLPKKENAKRQFEYRQVAGKPFLRVTEVPADGEGEQMLFDVSGPKPKVLKVDNEVAFAKPTYREFSVRYAGAMSDADHAAVAAEAVAEVDVFKTGKGPKKGHLACLWAARHVVHKAVGKWITKVNGTSAFYRELRAGGIESAPADDLPPGAIIISPTTRKGVGHIGLLGDGKGDARLVYSNHSPSKKDPVARWEQNYSVGSFTERHRRMGLKTYFLPLPEPSSARTLMLDMDKLFQPVYNKRFKCNLGTLVDGGWFSASSDDLSVNRAIRTNNPGAINDVKWQHGRPGYLGKTKDDGHGNKTSIYQTPEHGVRSWYHLLSSIYGFGLSGSFNLSGLAAKYAGTTDALKTGEYLAGWRRWSNGALTGSTVIHLASDAELLAFAKAEFAHEASAPSPLHDDQIVQGFTMERDHAADLFEEFEEEMIDLD